MRQLGECLLAYMGEQDPGRFRAAVRACASADEAVLSGRAGTGVDCPTVTALRDATRDNVENNMTALLVLGGIALIAAVVFTALERQQVAACPPEEVRGFRIGFAIAAVIYLVALVAFLVDVDWFIEKAHFSSAIGLFACILLVVIDNGWRKRGNAPTGNLRRLLTSAGRWYFWLATVMVVTAVVLGALTATGTITLFWLEAALILLFVVFWASQTKDRWDPAPEDPVTVP